MFGMSIQVIDPTAIDHGVILRGKAMTSTTSAMFRQHYTDPTQSGSNTYVMVIYSDICSDTGLNVEL